MTKRLYVGNISFRMTDGDLAEVFSAHGLVESARVIKDRDSGRSKGFAFVEMSTEVEAKAAMEALNGQQVNGRTLTINEARPRSEGQRAEVSTRYSSAR
jgi:RNA recognition motif-containing protein